MRLKPTYEELKLEEAWEVVGKALSLKPTYEELKLFAICKSFSRL